jgi:hypothetical protein
MAMEIDADVEKARDLRVRKRSGWLVAAFVFVVAYAISVVSFDTWGLALGWLPSTVVAAAFGWLGYCFPWLIDMVAILIDLLAAIIG